MPYTPQRSALWHAVRFAVWNWSCPGRQGLVRHLPPVWCARQVRLPLSYYVRSRPYEERERTGARDVGQRKQPGREKRTYLAAGENKSDLLHGTADQLKLMCLGTGAAPNDADFGQLLRRNRGGQRVRTAWWSASMTTAPKRSVRRFSFQCRATGIEAGSPSGHTRTILASSRHARTATAAGSPPIERPDPQTSRRPGTAPGWETTRTGDASSVRNSSPRARSTVALRGPATWAARTGTVAGALSVLTDWASTNPSSTPLTSVHAVNEHRIRSEQTIFMDLPFPVAGWASARPRGRRRAADPP
ncbi:hypothetical protein YIM_29640 [Amycolatopsis sp. YIM 10]|nr:hypothetical protein YIM_29640 [Amycolatopsis sp. YIM 10]